MVSIGQFTKTENGFSGTITTLAIKAKVTIRQNANKQQDNHPDFELLTDHDDTVETYTGSTPVLTSIRLRNGYNQTLAYNSDGKLASVTDSYGRTLTFAYNSAGLVQSLLTPEGTTITYGYALAGDTQNLSSVTYPTATPSTLTYVYELPISLYEQVSLPNLLTGVIDENGNRYLSWTYDVYGRVLTAQTGTGVNTPSTTIAYNDSTGARTVTDVLGVTDTYSFATLQNAPKVTNINRAATGTTSAATRIFTYDANGYLATSTDWDGNRTSYVNDAYGDPTTVIEAVDTAATRETNIAYSPVWVHLPATIVTPGETASFTYDTNGEQLTRKITDTTTTVSPYATKGQTRIWTNTWSNFLLASWQTPNGNTSTFGYDSTGALTSITDPLGHITRITSHSGGGLPQIIVDPNALTLTLNYDGRRRPISSKMSGTGGSFTTSWVYDPAGNLTTTTLPDNSYLTNSYDTAHRLTNVTDALGSNVTFTLDALGDRTQASIYTHGGTQTWQRTATFDALGRELVGTAGAGQTTTRTYDPNGNVLSVQDGLNHTTSTVFDALNRPSKITDANAGVTIPSYDAHDRIIGVTDANNNTTSYLRDGFGDVIQQNSPDSGVSVLHYDLDANLTSKTDALGIVTSQTFDVLDRPLTTTYPAHTAENVAYTYDQAGTGFSFGIGRLTSITDAAGSLTKTYEERGNLASEKRVNGSITLTTLYTYDGASRIASMTYPDGSLITYAHDVAGYTSNVTARLPGASASTTLATLTHQPFGPMNGVSYGNGIAETWGFDQSYRPTSITDVISGTNLQNLAYGYDVADNVKTIGDTVNPTNVQTFGYDVINRLTSAVSGAGGYGSFAWTYDKVGNRLTQVQGATTTNYGYTTGTNRLLTITASTTKAGSFAPTHKPERRSPPPLWAGISPRAYPRTSAALTPPARPHRLSALSSALWGWPILLTGFAGVFTLRKRLRTRQFLAGLSLIALLTGSALLLNGCIAGSKTDSETIPATQITLTGMVHGGQQPVSGATIQLYAVGTTGDGSASTALIHTVVKTNASGGFSVTGAYICPSASSLVYLAATGGNPGLATGTNNTGLAMMAALGTCSSLNALPYVFIDELTTVGSVAALYPYMASVTSVGSASADAAQLTAAFALVNQYTNITTGTVPGPTLPTGLYASAIEIQTLGNILAACINSSGGSAGDGSACGTLFSFAVTSGGLAATDTIAAILNILKNPNENVLALYGLIPANGPFQPSLPIAPLSWSLPILPTPSAPVISPGTGAYTAAQIVSLSGSAGATIYYTTDGTTPTINSQKYTGPVAVSSTTTIRAFAAINPYVSSNFSSVALTFGTSASTITVTTNANGNITGVPSADGVYYVTSIYNNANRLAATSGTAVAATYVYDWAGQRYSKTDGGIPSTIFSYAQGGTLIAEDDGGTVTDYIYANGRPIATLQPSATPAANQVNYILADRLGTPQLASGSNGATLWKTAYQPFGTTGSVAASITQNVRFPGQLADSETGFYYNLNRDYVDWLGIYLETDPMGLAAGPNTYNYAEASPTARIDPSGLTDRWGSYPISQTLGDRVWNVLDSAPVYYHITINNEMIQINSLALGNCFGYALTGIQGVSIDQDDIIPDLHSLHYMLQPENSVPQAGDLITFGQDVDHPQHMVHETENSASCHRCVDQQLNAGKAFVNDRPMSNDSQYGNLKQRIWRLTP